MKLLNLIILLLIIIFIFFLFFYKKILIIFFILKFFNLIKILFKNFIFLLDYKYFITNFIKIKLKLILIKLCVKINKFKLKYFNLNINKLLDNIIYNLITNFITNYFSKFLEFESNFFYDKPNVLYINGNKHIIKNIIKAKFKQKYKNFYIYNQLKTFFLSTTTISFICVMLFKIIKFFIIDCHSTHGIDQSVFKKYLDNDDVIC